MYNERIFIPLRKRVTVALKIVCSVLILLSCFYTFLNGFKSYYKVDDYSYQNDFLHDERIPVSGTEVRQHFVGQGNTLHGVLLYLTNLDSQQISISLLDLNGNVLVTSEARLYNCIPESWNKFELNANIKKGEEYVLAVTSESGLNSLLLDIGEKPNSYLTCDTVDGRTSASLAMGIQESYVHFTVAGILELLFSFSLCSCLALALCYAIFTIERLFASFREKSETEGVLHAVFYAGTATLFINPIDRARTEVSDFSDRTIGPGILANVDVSKRIASFTQWIAFFAVAFILFYLLINDLKKRELNDEKRKVLKFLNQAVVIADIDLLLRCITFFNDYKSLNTVFHYSSNVIIVVICVSVIYLLTGLSKKVSAELLLKIEIIAFCVAYPVSIISKLEWDSGKLLFGFQAVLMFISLPLAYKCARAQKAGSIYSLIDISVLSASLIPFLTSFFIEFINILNQHYIYVTHLLKFYTLMILGLAVFTVIITAIIKKNKITVSKWKTWTYTWIIFGIACLNVQVPLEMTLTPDVMESANYSVLISDFLKYGDIPVIQHYGGHMMSGVWEGVLYALLNNDYHGAIYSPYANYVMPVLAILFFSLIKKYIDEDIAALVTLFFPFYSAWSYYGYGALMCITVWGFLKKNNYLRALLIWLSFVWCVLYRLDLGVSFGIAVILALAIYVIVSRNSLARRQLSITFAGVGIFGVLLWVILCILKGINPVTRLREFISISMSNQNWAYADIGYPEQTSFPWHYILVPFMLIGSLIYIIFARKFRNKIGEGPWVILLILGFAYFTNFSRGLVRHSLLEPFPYILFWDAYVFFALFTSTHNKKYFLTVFTLLLVVNSAASSTEIYSEQSIGDTSSAHIGEFTEDWMKHIDNTAMTSNDAESASEDYWLNIKERGRVCRIIDTTDEAMEPYKYVTDLLLEKDETFIDFVNKSFLYSALGRRTPTYVSQSPLQLSGELTQEMYINEIKGVPIAILPCKNVGAYGISLDGLGNAYHYYKISEYIYQNYVPLLSYGTEFAIWCLPERYLEFKTKVEKDYTETLKNTDNVIFYNCERFTDDEGLTVKYISVDPIISELQNVINCATFIGSNMKIAIEYETDIDGIMQVFYTTEEGEEYTEEKSLSSVIYQTGRAEFVVPITEYTRIRLDIPEGSTVKIKKILVTRGDISFIDYGYDGPINIINEAGNVTSLYDSELHCYFLGMLPQIWAENDRSINNVKCCNLEEHDGVFEFSSKEIGEKSDGNYLLINATYSGLDYGADYDTDDETTSAWIKVGIYEDGEFEEKFQYCLTLEEGTNDYIIRVSTDYYWYNGDVNAVKLICSNRIDNISMSILEGD